MIHFSVLKVHVCIFGFGHAEKERGAMNDFTDD